jgi:hypothetical protein
VEDKTMEEVVPVFDNGCRLFNDWQVGEQARGPVHFLLGMNLVPSLPRLEVLRMASGTIIRRIYMVVSRSA